MTKAKLWPAVQYFALAKHIDIPHGWETGCLVPIDQWKNDHMNNDYFFRIVFFSTMSLFKDELLYELNLRPRVRDVCGSS